MWHLIRNYFCCFLNLVLLCILQKVPVVYGVEDYSRADFPSDFVFGSGGSAYQVEGAAFEDGKTLSIWDTFTHTRPYDQEQGNGDVACDQYHKYKEDVELMAETGLEAYRFSISWPRLIPNGRGSVNPKALQYYNNLINELIKLAHKLLKMNTKDGLVVKLCMQNAVDVLFSEVLVVFSGTTPNLLARHHTDIQHRKDFTGYADVCFKEFGDRVLHWITVNQPNTFALGGYDSGLTPPGRCSMPFGRVCTKGNSSTEPYIALHNMLLAHASVVRLYRKKYKASQQGFVGTDIYAPWFLPSSNTTEDVIATQRAKDYYLGWFIHPLVFGDYPDVIKKNAGTRIPALTLRESKLVKNSFDFIGLNHYAVAFVKDNSCSLKLETRDTIADMALVLLDKPENTSTDQLPIGLSALLEYMKQTYGNPPIYIHENGAKTPRNETLNDTSRVEFMYAYIGNILDAIRNGSDTRGYILWSFLDGFELWGGYKASYGLNYVDLDDKQLTRYRKFSSYWYARFLERRRRIRPADMIEFRNVEFVAYELKHGSS